MTWPRTTIRTRESLSLRRAWIEIRVGVVCFPWRVCRSPYGERGLKFHEGLGLRLDGGRSPYGERGLKLDPEGFRNTPPSRSPYGERGLKYRRTRNLRHRQPSLSLRRAWIEIPKHASSPYLCSSLSLRRAWIEMCIPLSSSSRLRVALLTESVD